MSDATRQLGGRGDQGETQAAIALNLQDEADRHDSLTTDVESSSDTSVISESHSNLEKVPTARDEQPRPTAAVQRTNTAASNAPPHSVFTPGQKKFIVFMASWAGFFSPVSANIYFPALNALAADLNVSYTLINLTLTSYMIFQGLAPAFVGSLADTLGRRPAYFFCFVVYIAANIGLALQDSYAALFVLRCVQSSGSSATIAMASGVVADVSTPAERGKYMGFTLAGSLLGPAIGPVIGGVLAQFLGWRSIFWFLTIFAATFLVVFLIFFPETARSTVGNGSIPPKGWNMSLMSYLAVRKARKEGETSGESITSQNVQPGTKKHRFPNPLASLKIILDKQTAVLLFYNALLFAAFYDVTAIIPSQFAQIYQFNDLQIGLCYIPFGFGSMLAALVNGQLLDRNFARWCRKLDVQVKKGRDQDLSAFPVERARLEIALPATYVASTMIVIFGWILDVEGPLAAILVVLFFTSFSMTVAFNVTSTLLVDFYPKSPATATAANNLVRCLLGAGATAAVIPMINAMGRGWTFTFLALLLLVTSPMMWLNFWYGMKWRAERKARNEKKERDREARRSDKIEKGAVGRDVEDAERKDPPVEGGAPEMAAVVEEDMEREKAGMEREGLYRARSHDHVH